MQEPGNNVKSHCLYQDIDLAFIFLRSIIMALKISFGIP